MLRRDALGLGFCNASLLIGEPADKLAPPMEGLTQKDLYDSYSEKRGSAVHEAIDIMAPRGTPVRAVVHGRVKKLFLSKLGGLTIYLFDKEERYCYYYGHLDRYREGLWEGEKVRRGAVIGYVGSTGNADPRAPHLHLAIFELGPKKEWWRGTPINPYPLLLKTVKDIERR